MTEKYQGKKNRKKKKKRASRDSLGIKKRFHYTLVLYSQRFAIMIFKNTLHS